MLQLLQTGKALYVLAAICFLSLAGKFIARNLYKRLIRETDNMTLTKNKYLRSLKQKAENTYRVNQGITNTQVYLEKQLYSYRFMGLSLNNWGNFSNQMTLLCFLLGGVGAFASYWYRCDTYYIVLYGSMGILSGLLSIVMDSGWNPSEKRMQLIISLQDYMENSLFGRMAKLGPDDLMEEVVVQETARSGREAARSGDRGKSGVFSERISQEQISQGTGTDRAVQGIGDRAGQGISTDRAVQATGTDRAGQGTSTERVVQERTATERNTVVAAKRGKGRVSMRDTAVEAPPDNSSRKDIDYLKRSLEQIAVSREKNRADDKWVKDLDPAEVKLIGEILHEYLS